MRGGVFFRGLILVISLVSGACGLGPVSARAAEPVTLTADDGLAVYGTYTPARTAKALVLLFHQAGSGRGEYATIAPRLAAQGFASLAIDQRVGGSLFGRNQTAAGVKGPATYADAERDLKAALAWANGKNLPVVLWGSSYSAALVFVLAAENPGKVAAVLAFSPGEYLGGDSRVRTAAARVSVPVFVTTAQDADEVAAARTILAAAPARTKVQFIPVRGGIHGSSTLIASRNRSGAPAVWQAISSFLDGVVAGH